MRPESLFSQKGYCSEDCPIYRRDWSNPCSQNDPVTPPARSIVTLTLLPTGHYWPFTRCQLKTLAQSVPSLSVFAIHSHSVLFTHWPDNWGRFFRFLGFISLGPLSLSLLALSSVCIGQVALDLHTQMHSLSLFYSPLSFLPLLFLSDLRTAAAKYKGQMRALTRFQCRSLTF